MTSRRLGRASAMAALVAGCAATPVPATGQSGDTVAVLFIGNSLTYWNDLPGMVGELLRGDGLAARIGAVVGPDMGLEDHWHAGVAFDSLRAGGWDVVVMQQGPSATEGRPSLLEWSVRFADSIRAAGARPALYMVWPSRSRRGDFPGVLDSYRTAAEQIDGLLFPAGAAWPLVWAEDRQISLYGPDGFHPSAVASYLAALIMYQQLSGTDPSTMDRGRALDGLAVEETALSAEQAALLRRVAARANAHYRRP